MSSLARLRHLSAAEVPFRIRERLVLATDRLWAPPPVPAGPVPRWPWPEAPSPAPPWVEPPPDPWPRRPRGLLTGPHDPRDTWEWTRLQHLAIRAEDPRAPTAALRWLAEHPPAHGIGWTPAMEVALRLVSLVRIATRWPDRAFREAVHAHAAWIVRHPSRGTSANNHRVAELGALALAGRVLDVGFAQIAELPAVLDAQVHPDGVGVEASTSYLAYDLEWALVARGCGVRGLDGTLARAARYLWTLADPAGAIPSIGDDDGGRVLAFAPPPEDGYVRSVTGAARAALGHPTPSGWAPDARSTALGIVPTVPAAAGSACFRDGGLTVLRRGSLHVVFDHGPLGGSTLAAHGHADALSAWVQVGGRPLVVGRGTGRYNADPAGRRFHRGASAHPTAVVDGLDPSRPHDHPFLWRTRAAPVLERVDLDAGTVTARLDGPGWTHRRTLTLDEGVLTVVDAFDGTGRHHVAVRFPLAPGLEADPDGTVRADGRPVVRFEGDRALRLRIVVGGDQPGLGRHSPAYGRWVEATGLSFEAHVRFPVVFRTVLRVG